MNRSDEIPIPKNQFLDKKKIYQEFQKSKKKFLYKDNYYIDRKRFFE